MDMECAKCRAVTNHTIQGLKGQEFPICLNCDLLLFDLMEALPFSSEDVKPDTIEGIICSVVVNAFFAKPE